MAPGGGGVPVLADDDDRRHGVEAVMDKDLAAALSFPEGSMAPKVRACIQFVEATGGFAAIGRLDEARAVLAGKAGTTVVRDQRAATSVRTS